MKTNNLIYTFPGIAGFLLLATIAFLVYGLARGPETQIQASAIIEAPVDIVWNNLSNFNEHSKWMRDIIPLYNYNHSARQIRYNIGENTIMANQQVRVRKNAYSIDFIHIGRERYTEIDDLHSGISLHALADGSTEVKWQISYSLHSVSARVLNAFLVKPKFQTLLQKNIRALKSYIEH